MNPKVFMVLRILLGLFVLIFGLNKFIGFLPPPELSDPNALDYFSGLSATQTLNVVGVIEVVAGLALIFNKYGALMALILMSVSFNAVLFHATLDPANIAGALILLVLNIAVIFGYKSRYSGLLKP